VAIEVVNVVKDYNSDSQMQGIKPLTGSDGSDAFSQQCYDNFPDSCVSLCLPLFLSAGILPLTTPKSRQLQ
jgi:hypothetical protein